MKTVAIVQARTGSTRLPRKVLLDLAGAPVLTRVVNRTSRAITLDEVVVATTTNPEDEEIVRLCISSGWLCFRGSENDVLDRYYWIARECQADVIVRITSDCPMIEPEIVDLCVQSFFQSSSVDYVSNTLPPRNFPRGLDVEVMSFEALERAWHEDRNPAWREHVTPYIYRHPELFSLRAVTNDVDLSNLRWTVDTVEDLALARCIYEYFGHDYFSWREVLAALVEHPNWLTINCHISQKEI